MHNLRTPFFVQNKPFILLLLLSIGTVLSVQAQLVEVEKRIVEHIDRHNKEAIKLLEEVVNINSGSLNFKGVYEVGQVFKTQLDELGFHTRWVEGKPFGRAGHLFAEHKGKGKTILLIGHLDTVFELESPFQHFEMINDSTMKGPGVGDMKGGDVVIIESLRALKKVGLLEKMNIIVALIGDEESSGRPLNLSRHDLIEAAKRADIAIGFEDGDGNPKTAVVARRSSSGWELEVSGVPAHSSQIFTHDVGTGAIFEAARILHEWYQKLSTEKNLTFNPGVMLAGDRIGYDAKVKGGSVYGKSNIVAEKAFVMGGIRAMSLNQLEQAQQDMKEIVAKHFPKTEASITFGTGYPPLTPTKGNYTLLSHLSKASEDLGFGSMSAVNPRDAGAADISFTAKYVDMAIDGLGLGSKGGHTVYETADPRTISMQAKRAAVLMYRLSQKIP